MNGFRKTDEGVFQSTLPARGATICPYLWIPHATHFNPRSPHGERRDDENHAQGNHHISIHAPRTGSDGRFPARCTAGRISIHAPRTGSDSRYDSAFYKNKLFQSTLPARGATIKELDGRVGILISIHAPRTGSDVNRARCTARGTYFNPRSPHGERLPH